METLTMLLQFLTIPALIVVIALITHKGDPNGYKIIKESNTLGEEKFEVWLRYKSFDNRCWRKEETFDSEQEANKYIARLFKIRTIVREGGLENSVVENKG